MKSNFTVTYPCFCFSLGMFSNAFILLIAAKQLILFDEVPHFIFFMFVAMVMAMGGALILLAKVYKVEVISNRITVRNILGIKYSFDVSEVVSVEKKVSSRNLHMERTFIRTSKGKRLKLDNFMVGYKKMLKYLSSNGIDQISMS